jgi:hypothetical protein
LVGIHFSNQSIGEVSDDPSVEDDQAKGKFGMMEPVAWAPEQFLNNFTPNTM